MRLSGVVFQLFAMLGLFKSLCSPKADAMKLQPMMIETSHTCLISGESAYVSSCGMFDFFVSSSSLSALKLFRELAQCHGSPSWIPIQSPRFGIQNLTSVKRDSLETVRDRFPECSQNVKDCCRNHTYFKMNLMKMKMAMLSKRLRVAWKIKAIFVLPVTCPVFSMLAAIR